MRDFYRRAAMLAVLAACVLASWPSPTRAAGEAGQQSAGGRKVDVALVADVAAIRPGQPFRVGLHQRIVANWHTYWKNPGDSGEPTRITWRLPEGFSATPIVWPTPEALPIGPLVNFGYSNEVLLPVTITPPEAMSEDSFTLVGDAEWLVCEKICIPESATVSITLPVVRGDSPVAAGASLGLFNAADRSTPVDLGWAARVAAIDGGVRLSVSAPGIDVDRVSDVRFFPDAWGLVEHAAPQVLTRRSDGFDLDLKAGELASSGVPPDFAGIVVLSESVGDSTVRNAVLVAAAVSGQAASNETARSRSPPEQGGIGLWQAVAFALLGGLILNLMPCVLPIISLKVMSVAASGQTGSGQRASALSYLAGVMVSFATLAAMLALFKAAGQTLGWGFQFQSPTFVLSMAALFFVLGLSMSGVFEIGSGLVGAGDGLTRRDGLSAPFFTGVLASVAATPCTAPFMGAAVGYALTRSSFEMTVVLLALGLGFAAPVVLLSMTAAARRFLPRPGRWMETLKQALAFPLYATVAWLVWVLSQQSGSDGVLAAGVVLVIVAFAAWVLAQTQWQSTHRWPVAVAAALVGIAGGLSLVSEPEEPPGRPSPGVARVAGADMGASVFDPSRIDALRREGRAVFVNFTAAWCITCKVNERVALSGDAFKAALSDRNIAYVKVDWTNKSDVIAEVLRSHGRAGVPLYLLFPADPAAPPEVLPQLLTEAIVLQHIAALPKS